MRPTKSVFLFKRLTQELLGDEGPKAIGVTWRYREKPQPAGAVSGVPAVDAQRQRRAHARPGGGAPGDETRESDISELRTGGRRRPRGGARTCSILVRRDRSATPSGSSMPSERRDRLLIVQGVLLTELARAADFVLPGAS